MSIKTYLVFGSLSVIGLVWLTGPHDTGSAQVIEPKTTSIWAQAAKINATECVRTNMYGNWPNYSSRIPSGITLESICETGANIAVRDAFCQQNHSQCQK